MTACADPDKKRIAVSYIRNVEESKKFHQSTGRGLPWYDRF